MDSLSCRRFLAPTDSIELLPGDEGGDPFRRRMQGRKQ
jgi:hypothetical protein